MNEENLVTAADIARWMLEKLQQDTELFQEEVVEEIESKFGAEFVYENENGSLAINRQVLKEFRNLTEKIVVWERGERYWRFRDSDDNPNKRQAEY